LVKRVKEVDPWLKLIGVANSSNQTGTAGFIGLTLGDKPLDFLPVNFEIRREFFFELGDEGEREFGEAALPFNSSPKKSAFGQTTDRCICQRIL
jgi:hypothetical protein